METGERWGERFAKTENTFISGIAGFQRGEGQLETFEADDRAAVAFDDGGDGVPIGAAEVATDNEAVVADSAGCEFLVIACEAAANTGSAEPAKDWLKWAARAMKSAMVVVSS